MLNCLACWCVYIGVSDSGLFVVNLQHYTPPHFGGGGCRVHWRVVCKYPFIQTIPSHTLLQLWQVVLVLSILAIFLLNCHVCLQNLHSILSVGKMKLDALKSTSTHIALKYLFLSTLNKSITQLPLTCQKDGSFLWSSIPSLVQRNKHLICAISLNLTFPVLLAISSRFILLVIFSSNSMWGSSDFKSSRSTGLQLGEGTVVELLSAWEMSRIKLRWLKYLFLSHVVQFFSKPGT